MKVIKLGAEWGPAYEEAKPCRISHGGASVEAFIREDYDLEIVIPASVDWRIVPGKDGALRIVLDSTG